MCAIFGIVGEYDREKALEAFETLTHRGIDESRIVSGDGYIVGVHRLSITGREIDAPQPYSEGGLTVLFNGEIYNHRELAGKLGIVQERINEAALLHAAFRAWGEGFTEHLRGMYAVALIDDTAVSLYRDPFGKKPLYYRIDGESRTIEFASEMKALWALSPMRFRREAVKGYLSFQTSVSPHTFDRTILQLGAGESLCFGRETASVTKQSFYSPLTVPLRYSDECEAVERLSETLRGSVALRIPGEVECGALLSGGVDSSLIAAMSMEHLALEGRKLHTFSIGYEGFEKYDERPYARRVAEHIGSEHHEYSFGREDFLRTLDALLEVLDEPLADPAMVPLHFLFSRIAETGIRVVLTGDGSDELYMGYRTYKEYYDLEGAKELKFKNWLRNYFRSNFSMNKEWEWYKRIFDDTPLFRSSAELFTDLQQNRLLRLNVRDNDSLIPLRPFITEFERSGRTSPVDWYSFLDLKIQLGDVFLRKLDRMSMAHSIEARSPFVDTEVVATAFATAPELRLGHPSKRIVKLAAAEYLPGDIINRKKKGFSYPYLEWLSGSGELETIRRVAKRSGMFRPEHLNYLLSEGEKGNFKHQIFALYMLCRWMEHRGI